MCSDYKPAKRADALSLGLKKYNTGNPCQYGHISDRWAASGQCIACRHSPEGRSKRKKQGKAWYKKNKKEVAEWGRKYYLQNKQKIKDRVKQYREDNAEKARYCRRRYYAENKEKAKAAAKNDKHRRRAIVRSGVSNSEFLAWQESQKKICYWCGVGCENGYHVDHYHPLSKGGKHEIENLVIACEECNLRKNAKDPYEFAAEVGRLF